MSDLPPDPDRQGGRPGDTGPPGEPTIPGLEPPGPGAPEEGFVETCVSVITSPVPTLRRLTTTQPVGWAIAVIVIAGVASAIASATNPDPFGLGEAGPELRQATRGLAFLTPIFTLAAVAIGTAVVLLASKMLDGEATYKALFVGFGFASLPAVFDVVAALFGSVGGGGGTLAGLISFATFVWGLVLGVIAVREANRFSAGRAVGAIVLAGVGLALVIGILFAVLFAAVFSAFRGVAG
ncbi:MAG: Yip1 family protein [Nitriliruptorales bacterium]